ncbi:MAG: hypothetical protein RLZ16_497 [Bacteroidota bacterium]|jgi:hypothetical protein
MLFLGLLKPFYAIFEILHARNYDICKTKQVEVFFHANPDRWIIFRF